MYSPTLMIIVLLGARLASRLKELENFLVLFWSEIGAYTHVHHGHVPLDSAVGTGRPNVVTTHAILRPKLRPTLCSRSGCNFSRLLIRCATNQPRYSSG
jgi:hypothetical protein